MTTRKEIAEIMSGWFASFSIAKLFLVSILYGKIVKGESLISGLLFFAALIIPDIIFIAIALWRKKKRSKKQ